MTREERENAIRCLKKWSEESPYIRTYRTALEALEQEPSPDYKIFGKWAKEYGARYKNFKHFAEWVADEILDEYWDYNEDSFAEIACRKLEKLGLVKSIGTEWVRVRCRNETNS